MRSCLHTGAGHGSARTMLAPEYGGSRRLDYLHARGFIERSPMCGMTVSIPAILVEEYEHGFAVDEI